MSKADSRVNYLRTGPNREMLRRAIFLAACLGLAAFALLLVKLFRLQILEHERYEQLALQQQLRQTPTSAARGRIYDTRMQPLAISASVDTVYLSPAEIELYGEDRELIAKGLSEILGLDRQEVLEKASRSGSWYVTVARKLEREQADAVRAFKLEHGLHGLRLETDTKRYYPNASLACHLIGFVGTDNSGLEGIEANYDRLLSGSNGRTVRATNAFGTDLLFSQFEDFYPGEDGCDIVTTLDSTVQFYLEKHLRQAVADFDVLNGAGAIAMDVNSGAILGMASYESYDPNHFLVLSEAAEAKIAEASSEEEAEQLRSAALAKQWRNKALSDTYEPGSTFKILTLAMALEEGAAKLSDSFYCGGSVSVKGRTNPIRCWKSGGHGSQTLTQAVQHSCNAAFVNIGLRIGAERFYDYCEAFGLLEKTGNPDENLSASTGIDLAGESGSIWWSVNVFTNPKNLSQLAAASFGQTFTITPLQLITAVSACVNGGRLMKPYVVREVLRSDGSVAMEREPEVLRQVISEETSAKVRAILEQVVGDPNDGTGRNAAVAGYRIGGKTGTSEKVSLEAATGQKEYIVSFIGFAPADDPKIAILCFLDTPSSATGIYISGGQMAAPVVGGMMADILPYLGIERDGASLSDSKVPSCIGKSKSEASATLAGADLRWRSVGEGDTVTDQLPKAGVRIAEGTEMILYFGAEPSQEMELMPDLTGLRYEEARDLLSASALYLQSLSPVSTQQRQIISEQSIPGGTSVRHGAVICVTLINDDESLLGIY